MFAVSPQNDVVSRGHKHKKKDTIFIASFFLAEQERFESAKPPPCGAQKLLSASNRLQLLTAAPFLPRFIFHRKRSAVMPAPDPALEFKTFTHKTKKNTQNKVFFLVGGAGEI